MHRSGGIRGGSKSRRLCYHVVPVGETGCSVPAGRPGPRPHISPLHIATPGDTLQAWRRLIEARADQACPHLLPLTCCSPVTHLFLACPRCPSPATQLPLCLSPLLASVSASPPSQPVKGARVASTDAEAVRSYVEFNKAVESIRVSYLNARRLSPLDLSPKPGASAAVADTGLMASVDALGLGGALPSSPLDAIPGTTHWVSSPPTIPAPCRGSWPNP